MMLYVDWFSRVLLPPPGQHVQCMLRLRFQLAAPIYLLSLQLYLVRSAIDNFSKVFAMARIP